MAGMLKIKDFHPKEHDDGYRIKFEGISNPIYVAQLDYQKGKIEECRADKNRRLNIHKSALEVTNKHAKNRLKAMIMRD